MRSAIEQDPGTITCGMCGHHFDPGVRSSCAACPLNTGCPVACCPACGYAAIDPERSWSGRLLSSFAHRRHGAARHRPPAEATLADLPCGARASVQDLDALPSRSRERLHAYGVTPGKTLEVIQTAPVTVIRVGHLELAFEPDLAGGIRVLA
jgi:Fe2+ transport system protein FeoA